MKLDYTFMVDIKYTDKRSEVFWSKPVTFLQI